jgi:hypothetical protein
MSTDQTQIPNPPTSEPKCSLLVMCLECGDGMEAELPLDQRSLTLLIARRGWYTSVLTPPGQGPEVPLVFGVVCAACAPKVYPPEILMAAEERRKTYLATNPEGAR